MFCYQCEQAAGGKGCTKVGVCGKQPDVAALQDLLVYALRGLSAVALEGRQVGLNDTSINVFICKALFATLTNVNFDAAKIADFIKRAVAFRDGLKERVKAAGGSAEFTGGPATFVPGESTEAMVGQGEQMATLESYDQNEDIRSLKHIVLFGAKGVAAYADHAEILGQSDDNVFKFLQEALAAIDRTDLGVGDWVGLAMKSGETNIRAMELLDAGNTGTYGHPVPTKVPLGQRKGTPSLSPGMI